jgi:AraC-like DNA-binding protein/predicted Zn-dependent protease with MMP-like domain
MGKELTGHGTGDVGHRRDEAERESVAPRLSIASRIVSRVVEHAKTCGVDTSELLAASGVEPNDLVLGGRVPLAPYVRLWQEALLRSGNPAFGFEVAWMGGGETHDLLRFVCMTGADMRNALERASRYLAITTNAASWPVEILEDMAVIGIERIGGFHPDHRVIDEFTAAEIVTLGRLFTGVDWTPREVRFAHEEPAHVEVYRAFFRSRVVFGCSRAEVRVDKDVLSLPLTKGDAAMGTFFAEAAEKLLDAEREADVIGGVRRLIRDGLRGEAPAIGDVAAELGMSARTLRRRLEAENVSFVSLLDETRFALAKRYLEVDRLSIAEIAFFVGFSEPSAFHRAFRRWTGTTPQAYARAWAGRDGV